MSAKEYLLQIRRIQILIRQTQDEMEEIKTLLGPQGLSYDKISSSPSLADYDSKMLELIIRLSDRQNVLNEYLIELSRKQAEIKKTLYRINNPEEIEVLYRRYFLWQHWEDIAEELNYSLSYTFRLHRSGLNDLEKHLEKYE